jgi:hypothetical protein
LTTNLPKEKDLPPFQVNMNRDILGHTLELQDVIQKHRAAVAAS